MTDANGTRNNLNEQPTFGPAPRPRYLPSTQAAGDKASPEAKPDGNTRRTRRSDLAQKRLSSAPVKTPGKTAAKEGRRSGDTADKPMARRSRSSRTRRKPMSAAAEKNLQRSRKVTALPLTKSAKPASSLSSSKIGQKVTPSHLSLARRRNSRRKPPGLLLHFGRWGIRFLVIGFGVAAIGGTLLKVLPRNSEPSAIADSSLVSADTPALEFPVQLNQEIASLKSAFQELPNSYPGLTPKAFYVDVDTGDYVNLDGRDSVAAASTIKLPVLLAFFEEVDAGRIDPNQTMALLPEQIAEGSGDMQLSSPGTQFTALEVATQMIVNSDNTATNMMIDLLGGATVLNERFAGYGLQKTRLNNPLPDLEGSNTTSARDLVHTMLLVSGDRLTLRSRDRILNILTRTRNKTLLAAGLFNKGALTYNKTGDIESVLGDVSLVDLSNGKRYIVAALVERPSNDGRAIDLIQSISSRTYKAANDAVQPSVTPLGSTEPPATGEAAKPATTAAKRNAAPATPESGTTESTAEPSSLGIEVSPVEEAPYPSANPSP